MKASCSLFGCCRSWVDVEGGGDEGLEESSS